MKRHHLGRAAIVGAHVHRSVPFFEQNADRGITEPRRGVDQRLQHRGQVEGILADRFQHIRRCRLLFQRRAGFVEQAGVLDGDHGLRRQCLDQADFRGCEGLHRAAAEGDGAHGRLAGQHWHDQPGPDALDVHDMGDDGIAFGVMAGLAQIGDVHGVAGDDRAGDRAVAVQRGRGADLKGGFLEAPIGRDPEIRPRRIRELQRGLIGPAELCRLREDPVENRSLILARGGDEAHDL